jgi:hypothetical protein
MKKIFVVFAVLLMACSTFTNLDQVKAKALTDELIQKINAGDYANLGQYYTNDMNEGESTDTRTAKFQKLKDAEGDFQSMEVQSEKNSTTDNGLPCVVLVYKIKRTKLTTIETYVVVSDGGGYKVAEQKIEQQ